MSVVELTQITVFQVLDSLIPLPPTIDRVYIDPLICFLWALIIRYPYISLSL